MKKKRKHKEVKEQDNNLTEINEEGEALEAMTRNYKRKKKGLSKGDNRSNTKPIKEKDQVADPFEPCEVNILKNFRDIKTKDIQNLVLHYLGCTQSTPDWCLVSNRGNGHKVCVVMVEAFYPFIFRTMGLNMPNLNIIFPDGPTDLHNPGSELFITPASSSILEKEPKKSSNERNDVLQKHPSVDHYILSTEHRLAHEYPPEDILTKNDSWKRFTGNVSLKTTSNFPLYAIDCEMCRTEAGMEATRIAIIDETLNCVYKSFIKPPNKIVDYLTQYSGITAELLKDVKTTLEDVIKQINNKLPPSAIFIGHSLENDLKALKLYHDKIIDTSIIYSSGKGGSFKPGLRFLAMRHFKAKIQNSENGHDPSEDAMTCMRLVKLKVKRGPKYGMIQNTSENSLSAYLTKHKKTGVFVDKPIIAQQHCHGIAQALPATSDEVAVETMLRRLRNGSEFYWLHLYKLEQIYRACSTIHDMINNPNLVDCLKFVDESIKNIYNQLPTDTLFIVYSGCSGYWKKPEFNGSDEAMKNLMTNIVAQLRLGLMFLKVKN